MNEIKPNEIEKIIKENQFKYIELKGADGKKYGGFNQKPDLLKKKIESIKQFCNNLPDGIYYINFKISPSGDLFSYCYNKGNFLKDNHLLNFQQTAQMPAPISQIEKLQTIDEWRKQENKINELQNELNFLRLESKFASQLNDAKLPTPENPIIGFMQNSLPIFLPIIDKFFDLEQQKINQKQNAQFKPVQNVNKNFKPSFRPVPELNTKNFEKYLNYLMKLDNNNLEKELIYLKENNLDIFEYLNRNFFNDENNENSI